MGPGTVFCVVILPYPWPTERPTLINKASFEGNECEIIALPNGTISFAVTELASGKSVRFISQPFKVLGAKPRPISIALQFDGNKCWVKHFVMGVEYDVLRDVPNVPSIILQPLTLRREKSFEAPEAHTACQGWISNRRLKFPVSRTPRSNRQLKSINEEAEDLNSSILRMNHFLEEIKSGKQFLLGTLAGEMRAVVYWPPGRDSKPDDQWNPILLRMASKADLPLPVYCVAGDTPEPKAISEMNPRIRMAVPRISQIFPSERIFDLQDVLVRTVVSIDPAPQRELSGRDLIKELAHTMGAAHYDSDTSDFIEIMRKIIGGSADQTTDFICSTASALVSLSEWVLSELKSRKIIL